MADHLTAAVDLDGHVLVTAKDAQNPETTVRRRTAKGLSRKTANDPDLGNGRGPNPERGKGQDQETESGHGLEIDGVVLGLGPAADTGALAPGIEKGDTPGPAQGTRAREVKMISVTATIEIPKRKSKRIDSLQNPPSLLPKIRSTLRPKTWIFPIHLDQEAIKNFVCFPSPYI